MAFKPQTPQILRPDEQVTESAFDMSSLAILNKSEIEQQVEIARKYGRSISKFQKEMKEIASLSAPVALEMFYTLPRGGKQLVGASARFAEIVVNTWGNCRAGARVIGEDATFVSAQGVFFDCEKNVGISMEVRRRITGKDGRRFDTDMIGVTGNAASSIGFRNAVLRGVPKALWSDAYEQARLTAVGGSKSMSEVREMMIAHFNRLKVTNDQIFNSLGVQGIQDVGTDEVLVLQTWRREIGAKEKALEDIFGFAEDAEIEALMKQLDWNEGKRTMARNQYKGRVTDLLSYLKEEVSKRERVSSPPKAEAKAASPKPEPEAVQAEVTEPPYADARGEPDGAEAGDASLPQELPQGAPDSFNW